MDAVAHWPRLITERLSNHWKLEPPLSNMVIFDIFGTKPIETLHFLLLLARPHGAGLGHLWPNALCHQLSGIPDRRSQKRCCLMVQVRWESYGITIRTLENILESFGIPMKMSEPHEAILHCDFGNKSPDVTCHVAKALLLFASRKVTKDFGRYLRKVPSEGTSVFIVRSTLGENDGTGHMFFLESSTKVWTWRCFSQVGDGWSARIARRQQGITRIHCHMPVQEYVCLCKGWLSNKALCSSSYPRCRCSTGDWSTFAFQVRFFEAPLLYGEYQTLSSQGQIELVFILWPSKHCSLQWFCRLLQFTLYTSLHTSSGFVSSTGWNLFTYKTKAGTHCARNLKVKEHTDYDKPRQRRNLTRARMGHALW